MSCPIKNNTNTIELTVHTSCYWGLRLTLCYLTNPDNLANDLLIFNFLIINKSLVNR